MKKLQMIKLNQGASILSTTVRRVELLIIPALSVDLRYQGIKMKPHVRIKWEGRKLIVAEGVSQVLC